MQTWTWLCAPPTCVLNVQHHWSLSSIIGVQHGSTVAEMTAPQEQPSSLALRLARCSLNISSVERRHVRKLAEMAKDFLQHRWNSLIRRHLDSPALLSYSCDSTPLVTRESFRRAWGPHLKVTRRGDKQITSMCNEFGLEADVSAEYFSANLPGWQTRQLGQLSADIWPW